MLTSGYWRPYTKKEYNYYEDGLIIAYVGKDFDNWVWECYFGKRRHGTARNKVDAQLRVMDLLHEHNLDD